MSRVESSRTGALLTADPRRPSNTRACRSHDLPPTLVALRYPTGALRPTMENEGLSSTTSIKLSTRRGSSGANIVPCSLALATSHPPRQGVTPATSVYGRLGPCRVGDEILTPL